MKGLIIFLCKRIAVIKFIFLTMAIFSVNGIYAQETQSITGILTESKNNQAVAYATVVLIKDPDSTLLGGAISDENGVFHIGPVHSGKYRLQVSGIGYKPATKSVDVVDKGVTDAGIIVIQDTTVALKELVIVGDRVKAKSETDRTTFFMTKKMLDASGNGMDVLKTIPGIQIDFMQNISLEGSRNIQIFVDGVERDKGYISQLNPKQIEKVEIISKPSSKYDGNITGAINIVLKKERNSGINGHIYAEIPTSGSEIYIRPAYSLNYGFKKLNLYTSYNGEMTYLDIHESTYRKEWNGSVTNEITSNQYVRQKNWSHRINYGFDYFLSAHDQFNVYAFYNPYSRELDGTEDLQITGITDSYRQERKEDTDVNIRTFYSLYYKHNFDKEGRELTLDISNYNLKAENSTEFIYEREGNSNAEQINAVRPGQNEISTKLDYTSPVGNRLNLSTGVKTRFQVLQDRYNDFEYHENILAAYGNVIYKQHKYDLSLGLRAEKSLSGLKDNFRNPAVTCFPYVAFKYKLTSRQGIQLSYNRSIRRPDVYQLNPYTFIENTYSLSKGNPFLRPELRSSIYFEHSVRFKSNYFATQLFYRKMTDVINKLTFINDTGAFETQVSNMGTIHQYGVQFSGSLKFGIATINPYLKLFGLSTNGNSIAKEHAVENKQNLAFESGLSTVISFKHDIALSFVFQYASPGIDIQGNSFCDALYFLSLEKTIKQKIKMGIVSAIPFTKSFTYQGAEFDGSDLYSHYEGNVIMSFPFWFKLSYQFNSGKNRKRINRTKEDISELPKKGF